LGFLGSNGLVLHDGGRLGRVETERKSFLQFFLQPGFEGRFYRVFSMFRVSTPRVGHRVSYGIGHQMS
jgi:hypothetical protein